MLVFKRKIGESFLYEMPDGTVVRLKVLGIDSGRVRIGIDAPPEVKIELGGQETVDNRIES